jgi:hypothetical protein
MLLNNHIQTLLHRRFLPCLLLWLSAIWLQSCALTATLPQEKTVFIDDKSQVVLVPQVPQPKYLFFVPNDQLKAAFLQQMTTTMGYNKLTVISQLSEADFRIEIGPSLSFTESSSPYTVNDASSPYNGVTFQLSNCEVSYEAKLYARNKTDGTEKFVESFAISDNKEEKVKNSRTLGQMVTGSNKEKDEYRLKGLRDDVMKEVAEKGGRAGANRICSRMARLIKKGKL